MNNEQIKVYENEKTLTPGKLFYNWFAANIGIMAFVYGAIIVSYHLSFAQALLAALIGAFSFLLPGWVAVIGQKEGVTTFKMSRAAYGVHGNKIPNVIAWINMTGWTAVNVITGTLLLLPVFKVFGLPKNTFTTVIALVIIGGLVVLSGLMKEATLAKVQTWLSWIFGILTAIILIMFLAKADWHQALRMKQGSWVTGFLPAISIIAAGSGISWSMSGADWGAYVKPGTNKTATFWNTTLGGAAPLFILMAGGILLSTIEPNLASANDPFAVMYTALPSWFGGVYFLVAAGGLIPQCMVSLRSARINLATIGINISQKASLTIHGIIVILIPIYVLFISGNFLANFQIFLNFLGICLASWVAIFFCDNLMFRKDGYDVELMIPTSKVKYNWGGIISWIISTITGFLFTNNAIWQGPFAHGIFENNSLGVFVSAIVAIICMLIFKLAKKK
ncbi:purine-cytosine permease family protein [Lentilactobacillus buchneri]|uniref:purine-cytosine permease family protein n=1 Tax=Lentilactobacillus buchneri TaxID=1581 RepID=UPI001292A15C|nr:cytosine permease [Lentilactobacillus buchneri]MQM78765.1 allantoin permease [Lentilactobacillus buchneri]MQM86532.1 allantoin permease [Lentilactobacillus buchneri]MQN20936.1 allantoin permease [Lentilactobacillus buchneri]